MGYNITGKNMGQLKKLIEQGPNPDAQAVKTNGPEGAEQGPGPEGANGDAETKQAEEGELTEKAQEDGKDNAGSENNGGEAGAPDLPPGKGDEATDEQKGKDDESVKNPPQKNENVVLAMRCYNIVELANQRRQYEFEALPHATENKSFSTGPAMATLGLVVDEGTLAFKTLKLNSEIRLHLKG